MSILERKGHETDCQAAKAQGALADALLQCLHIWVFTLKCRGKDQKQRGMVESWTSSNRSQSGKNENPCTNKKREKLRIFFCSKLKQNLDLRLNHGETRGRPSAPNILKTSLNQKQFSQQKFPTTQATCPAATHGETVWTPFWWISPWAVFTICSSLHGSVEKWTSDTTL